MLLLSSEPARCSQLRVKAKVLPMASRALSHLAHHLHPHLRAFARAVPILYIYMTRFLTSFEFPLRCYLLGEAFLDHPMQSRPSSLPSASPFPSFIGSPQNSFPLVHFTYLFINSLSSPTKGRDLGSAHCSTPSFQKGAWHTVGPH